MPDRVPFRLTGIRAYGLAAAATAVTGGITLLTWPFFNIAPFAPLFLAVYTSARWGTRGAAFAAIAVGVVWVLWLFPDDVPQFSWIPTTLFTAIAMLATHFVAGRSEAIEAMHHSERRATKALEDATAAEAKLRQAQKIEAVGQLVAGVSHNFNNLLTITMGYTDLLLERHASDEQTRKELLEIRDATERGAHLTRQLLALTRKRDARPTLLNLPDAVRELQTMLVPVWREDIALIIDPASETRAVALIDPQDCEQVLLNLVINSRDALPHGGEIRISVTFAEVTPADIPPTFTATPGTFVRVSVSDNGTGMSEDVLSHLFEPFFTTKDVDKGTGLGLAFTHGVVRHAQGFVTVTSALGEGTTVTVYLPAATAVPAPAPRPVAPSPDVHTASATILVVEDEPQVRSVAVRALMSRGYTVLEAAAPAEALAIFARGTHIDLLLTDVVMPGMRGTELAARVREQHPEMRVVFMSGYHDVHPGSASASVYLDKPFTNAQLLHAVAAAMGTSAHSGS